MVTEKFNLCGYLVKFKQFGEVVKNVLCCYLVKIKYLYCEVRN